MTLTATQLRQTVIAEAVERALRECIFLLVYQYKDMFDHTVWAVLTEGEPCPEDSRLLCTINHQGRVEWKTDQLGHDPIPTTGLPLSSMTLPNTAVQFNNVTITVTATDRITAYRILCQVLATFEYTTDTFQTTGATDELSEPQSTTLLSAQDPRTPITKRLAPMKHDDITAIADAYSQEVFKDLRALPVDNNGEYVTEADFAAVIAQANDAYRQQPTTTLDTEQ